MFQNIAANLGRAASSVAGEKRRTVLNNRHFAVLIQLLQAVEDKQLLSVADFGQTGRKSPFVTLFSLLLYRFLLALPVDAERRVGDNVAEGIVGEFVIAERIAKPHVVGIAAANHHVRLGNGEGGGVELLPEAGDLHFRVQVMNALLHAGKHLARAHRHVVDRDVLLPAHVRAGQQQICHQVDNVAAGEVRAGFLAEGLRKTPHQILENIAAIHGANLIRPKIALLTAKFLDDEIQRVALHHALDDAVELKFCQHVLHIRRKTVEIIAEVALDILRIRKQTLESELAGIIKLVAGCAAQEAVRHRQLLHLLPCVQHGLMRWQQTVMKALHDGHGQDNQPIFVGLERPAK